MLAAGTLMLTASSTLLGQTELPAHQATIDASFLGVNFGFAARSSARTYIGASVGLGGNWWNYMALGGKHFAEAGGPSYEAKDGREGKALAELLRGSIFVRHEFASGRQLQVGLKGSGFFHFDNSDDEPGGGSFVGVNITGTWLRWRALGLGSEVDIGRYSEGRPEFGVNVAPLLLRVSF